MGIDYVAAKKLIQLSTRMKDKGDVLMLGRHRMQVKDKHVDAVNRVLSECELPHRFDDLCQDDGYAETFFTTLGFKGVKAMDLSDFEGAEVLHDLNDKLPKSLKGSADLIYDGGTTEHVFDVAQAMDNIAELLRPGGVFSSCVPGNGFFAHGFYQFGPELVYGYWKHGRGYDVLHCGLLPAMPRNKELELPDPAVTGRRLRMRGKVPEGRCYLYYEVQKGPTAGPFKRALQPDYVAKWSEFDEAEDRDGSDITALREAHKAGATEDMDG